MARLTSQQGSPSAVLRLIDKAICDMTTDELISKLELLRGARLQAGAKSSAKRKASVGNAPKASKDDGWSDSDEML